MKICVTASGKSLDAPVDPRFGRCAYFLFVDSETLDWEAVDNPYVDATGGAGVQAAQFVASRGVGAVVTGQVGPNAERALRAAEVQIGHAAQGTVREAVQAFRTGAARFEPAEFQPGDAAGAWRDEGRGRRLGRGRGLGIRRKRG